MVMMLMMSTLGSLRSVWMKSCLGKYAFCCLPHPGRWWVAASLFCFFFFFVVLYVKLPLRIIRCNLLKLSLFPMQTHNIRTWRKKGRGRAHLPLCIISAEHLSNKTTHAECKLHHHFRAAGMNAGALCTGLFKRAAKPAQELIPSNNGIHIRVYFPSGAFFPTLVKPMK